MNRKTIKSIIRKKMNEWYSTIKDERVRNLAEKNTIVTGGCIVSMLSKEDIKDFDVYFADRQTALVVAEYYVSQFKQANPGKNVQVTQEEDGQIKIKVKSSGEASETPIENQAFDDVFDELSSEQKNGDSRPKYRPVYMSSNAITLSNSVQLVLRFYGEAEEIHKNYDFVHCTNYWTSKNDNLVLNPLALEAILAKELKYMGSKYPLCSVIRTRKFIKRGWHINAGQYLKMLMQVSQLDLTNIKVLEDQLTGVDSSYFMVIIDALKAKQESNPNWRIDSSYIAEIVDRVF